MQEFFFYILFALVPALENLSLIIS